MVGSARSNPLSLRLLLAPGRLLFVAMLPECDVAGAPVEEASGGDGTFTGVCLGWPQPVRKNSTSVSRVAITAQGRKGGQRPFTCAKLFAVPCSRQAR